MRNATKKSSGKVLASVALLAAAAGVAGLGTFGSFTSTTSASQSVGSGTVTIALGTTAATNRLNVAASGLVPGDTVERAVNLTNSGNQDLSTVTLTTSAPTTSSKLDTDATNGLQMIIESCSNAWTEAGTAPAYTYTCSGTTKTVLATRAIVGANQTLSNLQSLGSTKTDFLRVKLTLPAAADNSFQGLSSVVNYDFTGTQRTATTK
jgi:predicted ribosomally synthesized peptide with SipW-like signal peptide